MNDLQKIEIMKEEHARWQRVVEILRELGVEINDHNELNDALIDWADEYHELQKSKEVQE